MKKRHSKGRTSLVNYKAREITIKDFSSTLNIKSVAVLNIIQNAPDTLTNQEMGGIDLKNLCKTYNLNSKLVFDYCEAQGYIDRGAKRVPLTAIDKWVSMDSKKKGKKNKVLGTDKDILLMYRYGTLFVNTNSRFFDGFCKEINKQEFKGYNSKVKASDFKLGRHTKEKLLKHKLNK
jgi:hypothetical protein